MVWKVAEAKQKFSELVKAAQDEPQWIYNRERLVAAMVPAETLKEYLDWRHRNDGRTVGAAFAELRSLCEEEDYTVEIPSRQERPNPFAEALDELSR